MSTDLITVSASPEKIEQIDQLAQECRLRPSGRHPAGPRGIRALESHVTDEMMTDVMALQGKPLGFKTDKDRDRAGEVGPGYPVHVVRPAFIEATVRGFRPVNNEFNIIAGRFYGAKTGFERLIKTFPGLTDFQESASVPERAGARAFVTYVAAWCLGGKPMEYQRSKKRLTDGTEFDDRFSVRVNEGMLDDAILGKAFRKAYAAIYDLLTGQVMPTPEGEVEEPVNGQLANGPKIGHSPLFADAPDSEPLPVQTAMIAEYEAKLAECDKKAQIGGVARQAGADMRLTTESRAVIMEMCGARRKEV